MERDPLATVYYCVRCERRWAEDGEPLSPDEAVILRLTPRVCEECKKTGDGEP